MEAKMEVRWHLRKEAVEMYRSVRPLYYDPKGAGMYLIQVRLVDGQSFSLPFDCEGKMTPYQFVTRFVLVWIFFPREIEAIELLKDRIYFESYRPKEGWYRREVP